VFYDANKRIGPFLKTCFKTFFGIFYLNNKARGNVNLSAIRNEIKIRLYQIFISFRIAAGELLNLYNKINY